MSKSLDATLTARVSRQTAVKRVCFRKGLQTRNGCWAVDFEREAGSKPTSTVQGPGRLAAYTRAEGLGRSLFWGAISKNRKQRHLLKAYCRPRLCAVFTTAR